MKLDICYIIGTKVFLSNVKEKSNFTILCSFQLLFLNYVLSSYLASTFDTSGIRVPDHYREKFNLGKPPQKNWIVRGVVIDLGNFP